jgi:hypothetical protein
MQMLRNRGQMFRPKLKRLQRGFFLSLTFISNQKTSALKKILHYLNQNCTNNGCQIAEENKYFTVAINICGPQEGTLSFLSF